MALNYYREHNGDCVQKYRTRLHTRKAQEAPSNKWKRCHCSIYASGKLADGFKRKNTNQSTWEKAEEQGDLWIKAGRWNAPSLPLVPVAAIQDPLAVPIASEMEAFFQKCIKRHPPREPATIRKHRYFRNAVVKFCTDKGYVLTGQIQKGDMEAFYDGWKGDSVKARLTKLGTFRKLAKFLLKRKSLTAELAEEIFDIPLPEDDKKGKRRSPYTDDELQRFYDACDKLGTVTWWNGHGEESYTGEDVKDFIILDIHTGMRISDIALFDTKDRLRGDNMIYLRQQKTDGDLLTWVPNWVQERLNDRERRFGSKLFKSGDSTNLNTITDTWRRRLQTVFDLAAQDGKGPFKEKPIPHRFRYTFVRILIEKRDPIVPIPIVAMLSGDTEKVLMKYYMRWMPAMQENLIDTLKAAFADKTRLVVHQGGKVA